MSRPAVDLRRAARRAARWWDVAVSRARSPLARRAARDRFAGLALAAVVAAGVGTLVSDAEAARDRWGTAVEVVVARRPIAAGAEVRPGDVELRAWPAWLVPDRALRAVPTGRRTTVALGRGEPLLSSRLAGEGAGATAAVVPDGDAAVSVPLGAATPALEVGDRVDVLAPAAPADPWGEVTAGGVEIVAAAAEVVAVAEDHATIVVARDELERTAAAILDGALTLAVTG